MKLAHEKRNPLSIIAKIMIIMTTVLTLKLIEGDWSAGLSALLILVPIEAASDALKDIADKYIKAAAFLTALSLAIWVLDLEVVSGGIDRSNHLLVAICVLAAIWYAMIVLLIIQFSDVRDEIKKPTIQA